jgi:hypothetical protein
MNKRILLYLLAVTILSLPAIAQPDTQAQADTALLGLPGDNLDLYATLDLFQKSKTIEDFEKSLNLKETGINNLDLNLDGNVDFIKVVTKQEGSDFTFILQDDISEKEVQDVAVILLSKDKDGKVTLQIVGDKDLYGKDYVIEPKPAAPTVTPNPAYTGTDPVPAPAPATAAATTTVVVVESAPVVQYVYSPVYVPYVPPYYYGFYPPYHTAFRVVAVSTYHHNHYYHGGYHGGHGNTVVIHNDVNFNNYNNSRRTSNTVTQHNANGNYNANRPSAGTTQAGSAAARPSTNQTAGQSKGTSAKTNTSNTRSKSSSAKPQTSSTSRSSATRATGSRSMGGRRR